MLSKRCDVNSLPFDKKVMNRAKKHMKPYLGVHQFWWIFWAIVCAPVLILIWWRHSCKLKNIQHYNEAVYYAVYNDEPLNDPNPHIPFWLVLIVFYILFLFIKHVILGYQI